MNCRCPRDTGGGVVGRAPSPVVRRPRFPHRPLPRLGQPGRVVGRSGKRWERRRPVIRAELLGVSEKTVRAWTQEGVLKQAAGPSSRILLDAERVHEVLRLVKDLRAAGKTVGLLDEVHRRLVDATWLDRGDLTESLEQMRRGEGTARVAKVNLPRAVS